MKFTSKKILQVLIVLLSALIENDDDTEDRDEKKPEEIELPPDLLRSHNENAH